MRGTILGVHDGKGVLLGVSDQRLEFPLAEWRSPGAPTPGQVVDYVDGEPGFARGVFAVPGAPSAPSMGMTGHSTSVTLGAIAVGCLALGFIIPVIPTIVAFVLGCIGANRAQQDRDENGLLLSRIGWIGALVLMALGIVVVLGLLAFVGGIAGLAITHGSANW